jgi:hypothetical protein
MASVFETAFAAFAAPSLLEQFGVEVTYSPAGGTAGTLTAIVTAEESRESADPDGRRVVRVRELTVSADPAGDYGGVAAVSLNDTVTIDGTTYAVSQVNAVTDSLITCEITRVEDMQRSRPGYRRGR